MSQIFTAGRRGKDVRSDCWVSFEPKTRGGQVIKIVSKVASMYGDSIRDQCGEALEALEVKHCRLELDDAGALPWTIAARIETAILRSKIQSPKSKIAAFLPQIKKHCLYSTSRDRLRRTRLYLPGNEPKFFINAGLHKPDGVILDLEDSVHPAEKDGARVLVRNALRQVNFYGAERMVRINQGAAGLEDLEWVAPHNVHVILIPKCESAEQVKAADAKIAAIAKQSSLNSGTELKTQNSKLKTLLMPIIESALGGIKSYEIATASPNIVALAIGLEDYTADIGVPRTMGGRESFWLRTTAINAARAAGVLVMDTVFSDVADMDGLRASVLEAKSLGFDGKGCIHPRQIAVIHEAFAPDPKEVERARKIVAAYEEAQKQGLGVVALGSKMIDPPVVKRALRTVKLAKALERR